MATLGDYIRHLQEIDKQPDQSCVACVSPESSFDHICPNNPILTCNCADPNACAELGSDPDNGNRICPDSGKLCHTDTCPNKCLGDKDGFADNIDYTGIPYPSTKGKDEVRGWPCVVVGAVCEAWTTATERVSGSEHSAGHTERHTDARQELDGSDTTAQLRPTI
jgi:hypothetical protein